MKRVLKISALVLVYLLTCAKSCNDRQDSDNSNDLSQVNAAKDSISSAFSADTLSSAGLRALETTARYKLSDFSDYLRVFTDTNVSPAFRTKAGEMISNLFVSRDVWLEISCSGHRDEKGIRLKDMLDSEKKSRLVEAGITSDSISVKQSLHRVNDTLLSGQLAFRIQCTHMKGQNRPLATAKDNVAEILVVKRLKIFGSDSLKVWKIFLGDFRRHNVIRVTSKVQWHPCNSCAPDQYPTSHVPRLTFYVLRLTSHVLRPTSRLFRQPYYD